MPSPAVTFLIHVVGESAPTDRVRLGRNYAPRGAVPGSAVAEAGTAEGVSDVWFITMIQLPSRFCITSVV